MPIDDNSRQGLVDKINLLNLKHLDDCVKLDNLTMKGLWNIEQWKTELSDPRRICLGTFKERNLTGVGCGWLVVDEIHITVIAVTPRHQRKGIATKIISSLLKEAKNRGSTRATLEVSEENIAAINLYQKFGFKSAGTRRNFYSNGSNAIIKWLSLGKSDK